MHVLLHVTAFIGRRSYGPQGRYASLKESKSCRRVKASLGLTGVWNRTQVVGVPGDSPNDVPLLFGCSLLRQPLDGPLNLHHGHPDQATAPSVNLQPRHWLDKQYPLLNRSAVQRGGRRVPLTRSTEWTAATIAYMSVLVWYAHGEWERNAI